MKALSSRLLTAFLFSSSLVLSAIPTLQANQETPRGEITARSCNASAHRQTQQDTISFTATLSASAYKIGEDLQLTITAEENSYVTITDQGSDPNENHNKVLFENEELVAGEKKRFPSEGYKLAVKPPAGTNTFEILLSHEKPENNEPQKEESSRDVELEKLPETKAEPTRCIITFEITQ